jgi:hypothetical protein
LDDCEAGSLKKRYVRMEHFVNHFAIGGSMTIPAGVPQPPYAKPPIIEAVSFKQPSHGCILTATRQGW